MVGPTVSQTNTTNNKTKETPEKNFTLPLPIIPEDMYYFVDSKCITREVGAYLIDTQLYSSAVSNQNMCHLPMFSKLTN